MAGRLAHGDHRGGEQDLGFDKPIYEQYGITMKKVFTGDVVSYTQSINVIDEVGEICRSPCHLRSARG